MVIEYKNIVINADNIHKYRQRIHAGYRKSLWSPSGNPQQGADVIYIYAYSIDPDLKLSGADSLYRAVKRVNSQRDRILIHELHHAYNENAGSVFHIARGDCYKSLALQCLDEISARLAEELYVCHSTRIKHIQTQILSALGDSAAERSVAKMLEKWRPLTDYYCQTAVSNYKTTVNYYRTHGFSRRVKKMLDAQVALYEHEISDLRPVMYTPDFVRAVQHYFTFDGRRVDHDIGNHMRGHLVRLWGGFEPILLSYAKSCLTDLCTGR